MSSFVIEGGHRMRGEITPQGAKNEALEVICATLLTDQEVRPTNVPDIVDVNNLIRLLQDIGVYVRRNAPGDITFRADQIDLDYLRSEEYLARCSSLRGSILTIGPLVARFGRAVISKPGGDKIGRRRFLIWVTFAMLAFGLLMPQFLTHGSPASVLAFLLIGMALMGLTFGPMAALLPELFPTEVRYSGASLAYNFAAIIGASIATLVAIELNAYYGIIGVGLYLAANCVLTLLALNSTHETKDVDLTQTH